MQHYIVLDLEWNQGYEVNYTADMPFEIVEIGAVKLDSKKNIIDKFSSLVRPTLYKKIHYVTKRVISLSTQELSSARMFPDVAQDFFDWCGEDYLFCSWGPSDLTELQRNMRYHRLPPLSDGPITFLDVQKLFSMLIEDGKIRRSLEYAVDTMSIPKSDNFHRALSDAEYTAMILQRLDRPKLEAFYSHDVFHPPIDKQHEVHLRFDGYSKYISRRFASRSDAMEDYEVTSCRCFVCGRKLKRRINWFSPGNRHYYLMGCCSQHGLMHGKIKLKKAEDGGVYAIKTIRVGTELELYDMRSKERKIKTQQTVSKFPNR